MSLSVPDDAKAGATVPAPPDRAVQSRDVLARRVAAFRDNTRTSRESGSQGVSGPVALTVSVVVPTFKRPELLDRCLSALLAQDIAPHRYEVLVADDAACAETCAQVAGWSAFAGERNRRVRYVAVRGAHGPAAARNAGWRAAQGDIIAFTDDDCLPAPGWLRAGLAALAADETIAGVSGKLIVPLTGAPTDYERNAAHLESAEFVTANCFYRRDALERAGGFDERFPLAWREDTDLQYRLLAAGAHLVCAHDAVVVHPVRPARWGVSIGQQRKSMYNALLYKKHPLLYRERIQARPPLRYYAIVGALLTAGISAARGRRDTAALAALLWLALTGDFCRQRLRGTSREPRHVAEMAVTSAVIPPLSVYWRLRGALTYRVWFL